jgi:hypothetical protein
MSDRTDQGQCAMAYTLQDPSPIIEHLHPIYAEANSGLQRLTEAWPGSGGPLPPGHIMQANWQAWLRRCCGAVNATFALSKQEFTAIVGSLIGRAPGWPPKRKQHCAGKHVQGQ